MDPQGRPIHEGQRVGLKHYLAGHADIGTVTRLFRDEAGRVQVLVYWQGTRGYKAHWPDDMTVDWRMEGGQR